MEARVSSVGSFHFGASREKAGHKCSFGHQVTAVRAARLTKNESLAQVRALLQTRLPKSEIRISAVEHVTVPARREPARAAIPSTTDLRRHHEAASGPKYSRARNACAPLVCHRAGHRHNPWPRH